MIKLLTKLFIKDHENVTNAAVRRAYGTMCSLYGIFLNLLLFAGKYIAGLISGSATAGLSIWPGWCCRVLSS